VGEQTSQEVVAEAKDLAERIGKVAVVVKDSPGFVTSRINVVIGNEAMIMLGDGIADAEAIDAAIRLGLNHPMGPLELADMVGLDIRLAATEELHRKLGEKFRPAPLLRHLVGERRLGRKTQHGIYRYDEDGRRMADGALDAGSRSEGLPAPEAVAYQADRLIHPGTAAAAAGYRRSRNTAPWPGRRSVGGGRLTPA